MSGCPTTQPTLRAKASSSAAASRAGKKTSSTTKAASQTKQHESAAQAAIQRVQRSTASELDRRVDQLWDANERREESVTGLTPIRRSSSYVSLDPSMHSYSSPSRTLSQGSSLGGRSSVYMDDALDLELLTQRAAGVEIDVLSQRFHTVADYRLGRILCVGPQRTSELVRQASNHNQRWDSTDRADVIQSYRRGASIEVLAVRYGRTPWGIFCQLRRAKVVIEPEPTVENAQLKLEKLLRAKAAIAEAPKSLDECAICMDGAAGVTFNPCSHQVCSACAPHVAQCPFCRGPIISRTVVFSP